MMSYCLSSFTSRSKSIFQSSAVVARAHAFSSNSIKPAKTEYVHPLSQLVLEHLQNERSEWLVGHGLDAGLKVFRDGTFLIKFPTYTKDSSRIWTSYDDEEKKHWLSVQRGELVGRFMLQDNLKPAWNDNRSTPERIQAAVDSMIEKIDTEMSSNNSSNTMSNSSGSSSKEEK